MKLIESETIELKTSTGELKNALEDLCALANSQGGTIYFGVDDKGKILGQEVSDSTIKRVSTTILNSIEPRLYPNIYSKELEGKSVLIVEIKATPDKPYQLKGKFYKRVGTTNAYLSVSEVKRLLFENQESGHRFENIPVSKYQGPVNEKIVQWFIKKAIEERDLPVSAKDTSDIILDKLELKTDGVINFAGLMGFGERIQRYYPNTILKCAVFDGINKVGAIKAERVVESNIFDQLSEANQFFLNHTKEISYIDEETAQRKWKYTWPLLALREAVSNAVAHRDYTIASHIDIALFDDRVEISSPGLLPGGITLDDLKRPHKSILRNPLIAELLYLTGYIERWGSGTEKMIQMMKDEGLPIPEYSEQSGSFMVTFYKPVKDLINKAQAEAQGKAQAEAHDLTSVEIKILDACKSGNKKSSELLAILGYSSRTGNYKKALEHLLKEGYIEKTEKDDRSPRQQYRITDKGKF